LFYNTQEPVYEHHYVSDIFVNKNWYELKKTFIISHITTLTRVQMKQKLVNNLSTNLTIMM